MGRRSLVALLVMVFAAWYLLSPSTAYQLLPEHPVKGDVIELSGSCTPGSEVPVALRFKRLVQVTGGEYEYDIGTIEIPSSSTLSVRAQPVENLKIGWKLLIWFTLESDAVEGVASFTRSVPGGRYTLKVFGDALGSATTVELSFKASTTISCRSDGSFTYTYDSSYLPVGVYTVEVAGEEMMVELSRPESPTTTTLPQPEHVTLVANDIDYSLSEELIGRLGDYGLTLVRTMSPGSCALILGGPDAYEGVGMVVRGYLDDEEQELVREHGSRMLFKKGGVLIVAGSDREMTHRAFEERFAEVAANLLACLEG